MGTTSSRRGMLGMTALAVAFPAAISQALPMDHQSQSLMVSAAPRHPDAHLMRLCRAWMNAEAEWQTIWAPYAGGPGSPPKAEQERAKALAERNRRIEDMIARTSARTPEGREAKARVLLGMLGISDDESDPREVMARSLARDCGAPPA